MFSSGYASQGSLIDHGEGTHALTFADRLMTEWRITSFPRISPLGLPGGDNCLFCFLGQLDANKVRCRVQIIFA